MVGQSTSQSLGKREQRTPSLFTTACSVDSSTHQEEETTIGGSEHSHNDSMLSFSDDLGREEDKFSHDSSSLCSSNNSTVSEYSGESDSDLSIYADCDDGITRLEGVLQMGCMDVFFLPLKPKNKSIIKLNKKGEKELNLNVKGPLAIGLEAKMKDEIDASNRNKEKNISSVLNDNATRVTPKVPKAVSTLDKDRCNEDKLTEESKEPEFDHLGSIMSLSHGSSASEDEDCDSSMIPSNLVSPPQLMPFQYESQPPNAYPSSRHHQIFERQQLFQGFHQKTYQRQISHHPYHEQGNQHHKYHQKANLSHGIIANGRTPSDHSLSNFNVAQNNQRVAQKRQGKLLRSPLSTGSMPSQIIVEEQSLLELESHSSYEVTMAPDPPSLALPRIIEDDYPDTCSEERSDSSTVSHNNRPMVSRTRDEVIVNSSIEASTNTAPQPSSKKELPEVERWRKANSQRLKQSQNRSNSESSIKDDINLDEPSDEASHRRRSTFEPQTTISHDKGDTDNNFKKQNDLPGESLAFDSIFTRRIEKRRASKLKKKIKSEKNFPDMKSDSTSTKDLKDTKSSLQFESQHSVESKSPWKFDNVLKPHSTDPPTEPLDQNAPQVDSPHTSPMIKALAVKSPLTLNTVLPSSDYPSLDEEDTENQVPLPVDKGKDYFQKNTKQLKDDDDEYIRPKNPFQDDDLLGDEDFYGDDSDKSHSLAILSNDNADVLQPLSPDNLRRASSSFHSTNCISSPPNSRRAIHKTTSPRRSSRIDTSPRHNKEWNNAIESLNRQIVLTNLEQCPSGTLNRTDSIKCTNSTDVLNDGKFKREFFDSNMYSTQTIA